MSNTDWVEVPAFVAVDNEDEKRRVSLIATAIAAGDSPDSEFRVTRVDVLNPEYRRVSLIAAAIAAQDRSDSSMTCVRISRKQASGAGEENHAS